MAQNYKRGNLAGICGEWLAYGAGAVVASRVAYVSSAAGGDSVAVAVILGIVAVGLAIGYINTFCQWITGLTNRIEDTAINTSETNENLALILKELKALREVETKHKQHFDTYADWMSGTMTTINDNIIKA